MVDLERELKTAMRTGKVIIGSKRTLKAVMFGKAKLIIIASNCPEHIKNDLIYYAKISGTPYYIFPGTSWELGSLCGKPFMVASLAIIDPGESDIMALVESQKRQMR